MSFQDILKKSFIEGYGSTSIGIKEAIIALFITFIFATYIFFCYRLLTRKSFYSKTFNISLVTVALTTSAIILTIQTSVVVSLGMVGALSIVRFRTPVKEPMDLAFLFWSISVGIICGAGHADIATALTFVMTVAIFLFDRIPIARMPKILILNCENTLDLSERVEMVIKKHCKGFTEKTRSVNDRGLDIICEIRGGEDTHQLVEELSNCEGVKSVSILKHDGEVTF